MSDIAIRVENLGKQYRIGSSQGRFKYRSLRDVLAEAARAPFRRAVNLLRGEAHGAAELDETIWALRDVSFEVEQGEVLGIIGRNGAGKTTLLRILSNITEPTEGSAEIHGRVGSLLEVGTGFHPELTGRDNLYLSGAILGMRRTEIERKFDEIVAFAEVEKFVDTPVKHYSSGMYLRLAFSVAAHLEPEILLVDEVLAVGDIQFRRKCLGRMQDVGQSGRTVLFVSHDMGYIRQLCERVIWLDQGSIWKSGSADEVCLEYETQATDSSLFQNPTVREAYYQTTYPGPKIGQVELRDADSGELRSEFAFGDSFDLVVRLSDRSEPTDKEYSALWFLHNERGQQLAAGLSFPMDSVVFTSQDRVLACRIGPLSLPNGVYSLRLILFVPHYDKFDDWPGAILFRIAQCDPFVTGYEYPGVYTASVYVPHKWRKQK